MAIAFPSLQKKEKLMNKVPENRKVIQQESNVSSQEVFTLFRSAMRVRRVQKYEREHGVVRYRDREPVFTTVVVLWLMIYQRLNACHTQSAAVRELQAGKFAKLHGGSWLAKCRTISLSTSGYNQARMLLPVALVEDLLTTLIDWLLVLFEGKLLWHGHRVFLLDGSGLSAPHEKEVLKSFPATPNQYGKSYWSVLRVVTAHELFSGIALAPCWGPMYGDSAVSEQALSKDLLKRLPKGSVVVGDANFGTFAMAWHSTKNDLLPIVRLTQSRATKILSGKPQKNTDHTVVWRVSANDKRTNPEIDRGASLSGRVITARIPNPQERKNKFVTLSLFTTLPYAAEDIIKLYLKRWNIELDLKSIKRSVELERLTSKSTDMIEKEILAGFAAYSLIRATITIAATKFGKDPRKLSFSHALDVFHAYLPKIQLATNATQAKNAIEDMLYAIANSPIQRTKRKRKNQPRILRPCHRKYPTNMKPRSTLKYVDESYA